MARIIVAIVGEDGLVSGDGVADIGDAVSASGAVRVARAAGWRVAAAETYRDHAGSWIVVARGRRGEGA
jgi:hypothetical protein